jgi:hypothetical protein
MTIQGKKHDSQHIAQEICISRATREEIITSHFGRAKQWIELDLRDAIEHSFCLESNDM